MKFSDPVRVEVAAEDLPALFVNSARALARAMTDTHDQPTFAEEEVSLEAKDLETLLGEWLNELLYLNETRELVYADVEVDEVDERFVLARVRGFEPTTVTRVVTARLERLVLAPEGFTATLTFGG